MKNKTYIVEPYVFLEGHYKQYFENLLSGENQYIYCDTEERDYTNASYVKAYSHDCLNSFLGLLQCRLINSYRANRLLRQKVKENDLIHFIEFEPFNFLLFEALTYYKKKKAIITVHSIDSMFYKSRIKNLIASVQRAVYRFMLKHAEQKEYCFVVHYEEHKKKLQEIVGCNAKIKVIEYPCPEPKINNPKVLKDKKFFIFGQIREDKGFYEFLSRESSKKLMITIAGKIYDERVRSLMGVENYTFIDKFISDAELKKLFEEHDFLLLPYGYNYTGGAGPLKDSFSYATPVASSNIPIFREIVEIHQTGFCFDSVDELLKKIEHTTEEEYHLYSKSCLEYAQHYGWDYMRDEYFKLYKETI